MPFVFVLRNCFPSAGQGCAVCILDIGWCMFCSLFLFLILLMFCLMVLLMLSVALVVVVDVVVDDFSAYL